MSFSKNIANETARLIDAFRARPTPLLSTKLDILLQLAQIDDPSIVVFLLTVVAAPDEPTEVRINALNWLSDDPRFARHRAAVAEVLIRLLRADTDMNVRLQATFALAGLTDIAGVLTAIGNLALNPEEMIDIRYAAFTSLERCGPAPECAALLRQLTADETFGVSATSLLSKRQHDIGSSE
jgi:hypothetical protein